MVRMHNIMYDDDDSDVIVTPSVRKKSSAKESYSTVLGMHLLVLLYVVPRGTDSTVFVYWVHTGKHPTTPVKSNSSKKKNQGTPLCRMCFCSWECVRQ